MPRKKKSEEVEEVLVTATDEPAVYEMEYSDELEAVTVTEEVVVQKPNHHVVGQDANYEILRVAAALNHPALLIGDTGTGKTTLVKSLAEKHNKQWCRFNLTGETTVDEFVGKYILLNGQTIWQDGLLLQAMRNGWWLICDEVNAALPEILFVLHSLLDDDKFIMVVNHEGEMVRPHADFRFFATMNPVDEYAGTKELNKAFRSRFGVTVFLEHPNEQEEVKLISERCNIPVGEARKMVSVATKLRKAKKAEDIYLTVSTRDLLQWGSLLNPMKDILTSFEVSILNKCDSEEERELILEIVKGLIGTLNKVQKSGNQELDPDYFAKQAEALQQIRNSMSAEKQVDEAKIRAEERQRVLDAINGVPQQEQAAPESSAKEARPSKNQRLDLAKQAFQNMHNSGVSLAEALTNMANPNVPHTPAADNLVYGVTGSYATIDDLPGIPQDQSKDLVLDKAKELLKRSKSGSFNTAYLDDED